MSTAPQPSTFLVVTENAAFRREVEQGLLTELFEYAPHAPGSLTRGNMTVRLPQSTAAATTLLDAGLPGLTRVVVDVDGFKGVRETVQLAESVLLHDSGPLLTVLNTGSTEPGYGVADQLKDYLRRELPAEAERLTIMTPTADLVVHLAISDAFDTATGQLRSKLGRRSDIGKLTQ